MLVGIQVWHQAVPSGEAGRWCRLTQVREGVLPGMLTAACLLQYTSSCWIIIFKWQTIIKAFLSIASKCQRIYTGCRRTCVCVCGCVCNSLRKRGLWEHLSVLERLRITSGCFPNTLLVADLEPESEIEEVKRQVTLIFNPHLEGVSGFPPELCPL